MSAERLTQAEYARRRELSRQRVHQLVRDGRIPLDELGLVDVAQADTNLATMLDLRKATRERQAEILARDAAAAARSDALEARQAAPHALAALAAASGGESGAEGREAAPTRPSGPGSRPDATVGPADPPESSAAGGYWGHKAKREEAEAALAQLKLQERIGVLVLADEVSRSRRATAFKVANALTQLPAKLAPVVAPQDPQRAETLLAEEIDRVLNELADDLDQSAAADDAERALARAA